MIPSLGTSVLPALEVLTPIPVVASFGEGLLLVLQIITCVLLSLAALVFIVRFGCSGKHRCSGHGKQDGHGHCGSGSSAQGAAPLAFHGSAKESAAASASGEPQRLSCGKLPERCEIPGNLSVQNAAATPAATQTAPAAASAPVAPATAAAVATQPAAQGSAVAVPVAANAEAEAEQRRQMAVVAAAVHLVMQGKPHRIVRISPVTQSWALEGRRDIFSSHRIR